MWHYFVIKPATINHLSDDRSEFRPWYNFLSLAKRSGSVFFLSHSNDICHVLVSSQSSSVFFCHFLAAADLWLCGDKATFFVHCTVENAFCLNATFLMPNNAIQMAYSTVHYWLWSQGKIHTFVIIFFQFPRFPLRFGCCWAKSNKYSMLSVSAIKSPISWLLHSGKSAVNNTIQKIITRDLLDANNNGESKSTLRNGTQ